MENYSIHLKIAKNIIDNFINDWQKEPGRWYREVEIQAEIYSRISNVYERLNIEKMQGVYPDYKDVLKENQHWNRISLEPIIYYIYKDDKQYHCKPDIVIWDNIDDPEKPPDVKKGKNWPMQLICEIKTNYNLSENNETWNDIKKMEYIIKNNDSKFGLWLNFNFNRNPVNNTDNLIKNDLYNSKIWSYQIYLK